MKRWLLFIVLWQLNGFAIGQQRFCGIRNTSFRPGEQITYKVFYNLGAIYVGAGEAVFSTSLAEMDGDPVYHIVGEGRTYRSYDWIFKVRDRYESFVDTADLLPVKFIRNVSEGGYHIYNNVSFNQRQHTAFSNNKTFHVPECIQDVLSAIFYARNIDFNLYRPDDKIPFSLFLDDEVYSIYIRYLGREKVETRFGTFNAIKFRPLLIKGTIFQGGEKMTVWVSDDPNHVPLRIDSPISVGSIKVDLVGYKNLRYPLSSMISRR